MADYSREFTALKREILEHEFNRMNEMQRRAVFTVKGPLLILAGAGSGKTTVLVNRIAYLLSYGNAYREEAVPEWVGGRELEFLKGFAAQPNEEDREAVRGILAARPPRPWNILAITFTNKAAGELRGRLASMLGEDVGGEVNAGTFHSVCVRILRRNIDRLGYTGNFTIYDTDDSVRVIKDSMADLGVSDKTFPPKAVLGEISRSKDKMLSPKEYINAAGNDYRLSTIGKLYQRYQERMKAANALDFDDLIVLTVQLLDTYDDVLEYYQSRFRYILVDEYQDTNHAQYRLVSLLARGHQNLCVVGDDDQSIYRFRGATIENILSFEKQFKNAVVIRLEQNYRSTQNILDAANAVIANNRERKGKNLWTQNGDGEKIVVRRTGDEGAEAEFVASGIVEHVKQGRKYSDHAVLYRMNAQSNSLERYFIRSNIPYRIIGGRKFFERKEIRDMLAYLNVINNPSDDVRLKRIINEPKRGIGASTVAAAEQIAEGEGIPLFDVLREADTYPALARKAASLKAFTGLISELAFTAEQEELEFLLDELLEKTGYLAMLRADGPEGEVRIENIEELKSNMKSYEEENEESSLSGFLEEVALYTDLDSLNQSDDSVVMMTLHSAKGLEFPYVYIVGMEEGIFPSRNIMNFPDELEEERRLAYVGITRAKERLYLLGASTRMLFGSTSRNRPSRFLEEIPKELTDYQDMTVNSYSYQPQRKRPSVFLPENAGRPSRPEPAAIDFKVGDTVGHRVFGNGMVVSMTPMANDMLVEVVFDRVGTKKIMANFAKLKKL
ncbi:MAG: UvrD-helicase domain-containing protein [Oscillospiraceae bacterium]|nr:UvrD-helicase domain-containing protein [Oscillospiraceae bacterium]